MMQWQRSFNKHHISVYFNPGNTLRQRLSSQRTCKNMLCLQSSAVKNSLTCTLQKQNNQTHGSPQCSHVLWKEPAVHLPLNVKHLKKWFQWASVKLMSLKNSNSRKPFPYHGFILLQLNQTTEPVSPEDAFQLCHKCLLIYGHLHLISKSFS